MQSQQKRTLESAMESPASVQNLSIIYAVWNPCLRKCVPRLEMKGGFVVFFAHTEPYLLKGRRRSMNESQKCEYNFECEDYAEDTTWCKWGYRVEDNAPAKHHIIFHDKEQNCDFEYDVCNGCLASLENNIEDEPDHYELVSLETIAKPTPSYSGQRSKKYHHIIFKAWTLSDYESWMRNFHKLIKKHEGKKCDSSYYTIEGDN